MAIWFVAIALAGLFHIRDDPGVLFAINPYYAVSFLYDHGHIGLVTLGAVFLVVTGGEALYADLGHFGRKPIQTAWFGLVLPALLLNYFGQGAKVLAGPVAIDNPFYHLVPEALLLPMIVLATAATVIASQAGHRGLFARASGDPARNVAASRDPAHLGCARRPDLHPARDHGLAGWGAVAGRDVPDLKRTRFGLWHCSHHHHGGRRTVGLHRRVEALETQAMAGHAADRPVPRHFTFFANLLKLFEGPGRRCSARDGPVI
jgi:hypothetical protein